MKNRLFFFFKYAIFWLLLFITARFVFIAANYFDSGLMMSADDFFKTFFCGFKLDVSATAYLLLLPGVLLALSGFGFRHVGKAVAIYTSVLVFIIILITVIDIRFYKYLGARLDIYPVRFLKNAHAVTASVTMWDVLVPLVLGGALAWLFVLINNVFDAVLRLKNCGNTLKPGSSIGLFCFLKQFQLLRGLRSVNLSASAKKLHHPELAVGDFKNNYFAFLRQEVFHAPLVYFGIFAAGAMARIDGILHHSEAVFHQANRYSS